LVTPKPRVIGSRASLVQRWRILVANLKWPSSLPMTVE
jgi:hypothetical protein